MPKSKPGLVLDADGVARCWWAGTDPIYCAYHDREWGFPVANDQRLFEKICLEGFQAGLAWITILRKRENFRAAFRGFEVEAVARLNRRSVDRLMRDKGIVRHRGKIESTINNARCALQLIEETGSLAGFFWRYEPEERARPKRIVQRTLQTLTQTPESRALSAELKRRTWSFVGPTTAYAFMQAMGLVNDHIEGCVVRPRAEAAREKFRRPRLGTEA